MTVCNWPQNAHALSGNQSPRPLIDNTYFELNTQYVGIPIYALAQKISVFLYSKAGSHL